MSAMAEQTQLQPMPDAVLFACNMNRVRSPMAAALLQRRLGTRVYVDSCGLQPGEGVDPFVVAVMAELGADLSDQAPKTFGGVGADSFDLIVCLTSQAHVRATELARGRAVEVEYWPTDDPTLEGGSRAQRLDAYRRVRDEIGRKIAARFG
jgi:protein-tyrosine-phosphatase